jgi:hypothetical protein
MKLPEILQFIAASMPIVAVIWQVVEIKNQFYKYVDSALDARDHRISELDKQLAVHVEKYLERKDFVDYQLHGLNEKLDHKFQRCMDEIKDLKKDLE